jgi:hypothetical protein
MIWGGRMDPQSRQGSRVRTDFRQQDADEQVETHEAAATRQLEEQGTAIVDATNSSWL